MLDTLWKKNVPLMVGIDIGSHAVKAVLLKESSEGNYTLEDYVIEPVARGAVVEREIQDIDAVSQAIEKVRKKISNKVLNAATAVSGQTVITKIIFMDSVLTEEELASQIEIEADSLIPYPLDEVSLDFETLGINEADPAKVNVLLSAARTELIEAKVSAIDSVGFETKVVDVESYAISRTHDLCLSALPDDASEKIVAIIDVGATMTLFSATKAGKHIYIVVTKCLVANNILNQLFLITVKPSKKQKKLKLLAIYRLTIPLKYLHLFKQSLFSKCVARFKCS